MERYELVEGSASKFWEVSVEGDTLTVRYGRIGTAGQTKEKQFADAAAADKERTKLVKEKTGKGYQAVGTSGSAPAVTSVGTTTKPAPSAGKTKAAASASTSATPPAARATKQTADAAPASEASTTASFEPPSTAADSQTFTEENARSGLLFTATPLPSRCRPGPALDAATEWKNYRAALAQLAKDRGESLPDEVRDVTARSGEVPPAVDVNEMALWLRQLLKLWEHTARSAKARQSVLDDPQIACLAALSRWGVATLGTTIMVQAGIDAGYVSNRRDVFGNTAWVEPLAIAMRHAFTADMPEADYETALTTAQEELGKKAEAGPFLAFILADDRAVQHPLTMLAQLDAAQARGDDPSGNLLLTPLVAEVAPSAGARWRKKHGYLFHFAYLNVHADIVAATIIANARHYGEPASAVLDWLMHYATEDDNTVVAMAIAEIREDDTLACLMPHYGNRRVRKALDAVATTYPVWYFRQVLTLASHSQADTAIKARLSDMIGRHGEAVTRSWASGLGAREMAALDRALAARNVAVAPVDALPPLLQRMPWRTPAKHTQGAAVTLDIEPIATPFVFKAGDISASVYQQRDRQIIQDLDKLGEFVQRAEKDAAKQRWMRFPTVDAVPEAKALSGEQWVQWVTSRLESARGAHAYYNSSVYNELYDVLHRHHESLALALWAQPGVLTHAYVRWTDTAEAMLARFGERAAPGLVDVLAADPMTMLPLVVPVDYADIAPHAARALTTLKKARPLAVPWLRRHRHTALMRLIPDAVGKISPARDAAEQTIRWFIEDAEDGRAALDDALAIYAKQEPRVIEAIDAMLARDAADDVPAKPPKLPSWFQPSALSRPILANGGGALSDDAMRGLAEMLTICPLGAPYIGVSRVRPALTPDSAAAFAWDLFSVWLGEGAPAKENWALRAVGWLGDDECARNLTRLIRKWPGEAAHARAVLGLDVLADIGSDVALMNLNGIAEKLKFKGLQEKAREKIAAIAEARDLTPEELADRLAPDLGLDERGGLDLDFGPRQFRVGFDEFLKPWVKDTEGRRLKDLPKPNKSDDEELSRQASATWSALKKDARAVASLQIARLEAMLAESRRVTPWVFDTFFVQHPLIRHLSQRLLWGVFPDHDARSQPTQVFRLNDDLTASDVDDDAVDIDMSDTATTRIGLVHPLHLDDASRTAWSTVFSDYEIAQPFLQLGRETYVLTDEERERNLISRFAEVVVETTRLRGMSTRGWKIGAPQDGGVSMWLERTVTFLDGTYGEAYLHIEEGIYAGAQEYEPKTQKMGTMSLDDPWGNGRQGGNARSFKDLDPISASEVLRVPSLVAQSAGV